MASSQKLSLPLGAPLKPDGKTPRICGDYRLTLNRSLLQQSCTTEEPEDVLHKLNGAKVFSKIDLQNSFYQIPLDDDLKAIATTFWIHGLFAYNFLPFGISVSPSIFQKTINGIISGVDGVVAYQNDVIVFATGQMTHNQRLSAPLDRFIEYNVRINDERCKFGVNRINCLGFVLDTHGIKPDPERFCSVCEFIARDATEIIELGGAHDHQEDLGYAKSLY